MFFGDLNMLFDDVYYGLLMFVRSLMFSHFSTSVIII
jgi:hypothetical protein